MKVLMAARWPVGGIKSFLESVYQQACFEGVRIVLLAPGADLSRFFEHRIPRERFHVKLVADDARSLRKAIRGELATKNYDLLHSHGLTTGLAGEVARFGLRVPHILTLHDIFMDSTFSGWSGEIKRFSLGLALRRIDAIHTVSNDCAENLETSVPGIRKHSIYPIRNGIQSDRFRDARPADPRRELDLPAEVKLIGFFGRFMAPKGFRTLVDAIEILVKRQSSQSFRVLTFGWGGFIREDYGYLADKGLGEIFCQCPYTEKPENWIKAMDLIVMPSRWEACGLVAMEALAAGVPIVGTNCIGLREVLANTPATVVPPECPELLAEAVGGHLEDPRKAEFLAFSQIASERFSVSKTAERLRALYGKLAIGVFDSVNGKDEKVGASSS